MNIDYINLSRCVLPLTDCTSTEMDDHKVSLPVRNNGSTNKAHKRTSPIISLHSFVLGFLIGCVVIFFFGLKSSDVCIGRRCAVQATPISPVKLDVPLPREHSLKRERAPVENITEDNNEASSSSISKCPKRPLHVVIIVLASPKGSLRRNAIRGSWMHDFNSRKVKVTSKFLLGTLGLTESNIRSLKQESEQYRDMLLFDTLKDSYFNLSLKVLHGLNWAERELPHFDFIIKTDDDSFVQVGKVAQAFVDMGCPELLYWGYFNGHGFPEATGRWAEKQWRSCPHYLPYAMGGGYILTHRVVKLLVRLSDRLLLYGNEDVTIGSWLAPFELARVHDMRFNVESQTHGCNNQYIITHKDTLRHMYHKFKNLRKNGTLCSQEKEIRPSFIYNWTVSPANCCDRSRGLPIQQSVFNGHLLPLKLH